MKTVNLQSLELQNVWSGRDPRMRVGVHFPFFSGNGAKSLTLAYFELEPERCLSTHRESAEEVLLVLSGTVEFELNGERQVLSEGCAALIPARTWHGVRNLGPGTARCVGFFSGATVETLFREPVMPSGREVVGTPPAKPALGLSAFGQQPYDEVETRTPPGD